MLSAGHEFLDWPSGPHPEAVRAGLRALLGFCLRAGAQLCEVLGEEETRAECESAAARLGLQVPPLLPNSKQASALLALAGLQTPLEANRQVLAREPLRGLSTFYSYYVLQARALAGDIEGALEVIRRYWGAMLDLGATSFWEHFDLEWAENAGRIDELVAPDKRDVHLDCGEYCYAGLRHNLCHGWAAGPTAWLSQHVLGFNPLAPGCSRVKIEPHLADLEWAEGAFPTSQGAIWVRHQKTAVGAIQSTVEAPDGVEIVRRGA